MRNRSVCGRRKSSRKVPASSFKPAEMKLLPSGAERAGARRFRRRSVMTANPPHQSPANAKQSRAASPCVIPKEAGRRRTALFRSEEHTSELQSHSDLVCRLLLEKKKEKKQLVDLV